MISYNRKKGLLDHFTQNNSFTEIKIFSFANHNMFQIYSKGFFGMARSAVDEDT